MAKVTRRRDGIVYQDKEESFLSRAVWKLLRTLKPEEREAWYKAAFKDGLSKKA